MKNYPQYISIDPEIRFGKSCIKGARISIADILSWLAADMTHKEILEDFAPLKEKHIKAALAFAADRETMVKIIIG